MWTFPLLIMGVKASRPPYPSAGLGGGGTVYPVRQDQECVHRPNLTALPTSAAKHLDPTPSLVSWPDPHFQVPRGESRQGEGAAGRMGAPQPLQAKRRCPRLQLMSQLTLAADGREGGD